ncbi:excinuclease ABC subunit C [Catalinimonas alkaloidigena]|uniref:UvrABC system protein C n=1 Tax=Catalinimonas alkaloidigena TaxID=1075417 RepID=A0A1G9MPP3_9BACT|nr:excinuclease ABC subunit UvrC [Catalinimonas alkaloidigena]SDL75877.1 excinuclease ABC subunit C [Catalinimonas alkaloidigena]
MDRLKRLKEKIRTLPHEPGVYKYYNKDEKLIYVGKAKDLRKRVSSYFTKQEGVDRKTRRLVSQIERIDYTVVSTEFDALLLENNLIKENQPKYNILLRDDKTYPFICVTDEHFPRIYPTRNLDKESCAKFFGPYASIRTMNTLLELLKKLYTFRTCRYDLSPQNIEVGKFKVCLEYHIGNCKGPCEGLQEEEHYDQQVEQAVSIIKGNLGPARQYFKNRMQELAGALQFEEAQRMKERLELLENYQSRSVVVNPDLGDLDVYTISVHEDRAFVNYLKLANGMVIQSHNLEAKKKLDETESDILAMVIFELHHQQVEPTREILTNVEVELDMPGVSFHVPQRGDKKKLIELSLKNVLYFRRDKMRQQESTPPKRNERVLQKLQIDLRLTEIPDHIECFDNSNMQGTNPVAAMVCFKHGYAAKKEYRHFNIKTVVGANDFASMHEIVHRRYHRLLEEEEPLPQLIIIDGGKGQLSAACDALKELGLYGKIAIVGIAKRLEEIYFPEDPYPLHIDKKSESLLLIQRIRDEAHRFAIEFHRKKRNKAGLKLEATNIRGIGKKTIDKIYANFRSLNHIEAKDRTKLEALIGRQKADYVFDYLSTKKESQT